MGNCLDRTLTSSSDESDENTNDVGTSTTNANRSTRHRHRHRTSNSNRYVHLVDSSSSLSSSTFLNQTQNRSILTRSDNHNHPNRSNNLNSVLSQSYNGPFGASNFLSSSLLSSSLGSNNNNPGLSSSFSSSQQVYYLSPNVQRTADQLTEEEQIKLLKRMTLIQQLPTGAYDENKKNKECVICMIDFEKNDTIKYLPCMHTFHQSCIDTWLLRSLICPSCMEPVDAGLLAAYE